MSGKFCAICLEKDVRGMSPHRLADCWRKYCLCLFYRDACVRDPYFPVALAGIVSHNYKYIHGHRFTPACTPSASLERTGRQPPSSRSVTDSLFRDSAFFDPNDLVQVKYEMLRSVQKDGRAVVEAAQAFGMSRPVFYVTQALFQREGLPGLLPRKRGPKQPHKLNDEAMAVLVEAIQEAGRMLKGEELAALLLERCGVEVHPRSILRRLRPYRQAEKKR